MRRRWWWILAAIAVVGLPVAWYLGSPLFINRVVEEPFPMSAGATVPEGMTHEQVEATMAEAAKTDAQMNEALPAGASVQAVVAGAFQGADNFHKGSGTATIHRIGGQLVLRLDPFRVTNGPDLHVILAKHAAPRSRADVQGGYVEVAKLKGNIGAQNYALPDTVTLTDFRTVVIYCKAFHVVFATAPLAGVP